MKKKVALLLATSLAMLTGVGCYEEINSGIRDILYNDIVYERCDEYCYNVSFTENNAKYIGVFLETYNYGQQLPWDVYVLNSEENVLYSAHAVWVRKGYELPKDFGEEFSSVEYYIPNGIDFRIMEDGYTEEMTPLATFEGVVKLEDIVESQPTEATEFIEHNFIRFQLKNFADMDLEYAICSVDNHYYLNVQDVNGANALHKIKPEYVELLTSEIEDA